MTLHYFGSGDSHGRVNKNLCRFCQSMMIDAVADEMKQFLRSLQCEGGDDDISARAFACYLVALNDAARNAAGTGSTPL
jgi:hypothetical protein